MDALKGWRSHYTKCAIDFDYFREVGLDEKTETCVLGGGIDKI